ncbi:venom acid phosphatase Acph-1-like [Nasonia vitripennis]|uniref:Uncharacterized protein n=1 Tax=Nasonia vitripennis TaxID=7425 RepID=A0A7M7R260_NASVI|nr:venom acid phosphatase Acph-1-like [Nasonia vitripennis]
MARYHTIHRQLEESPEVKMFEKYNDFAKEMSDKTGELYPTTKLYRLFKNLRAALSMGLSLPDWCSKEEHEKLEDLAHLSSLIRTHTPQMTRIVAGPMVQQFLENIEKSDKGLDGKEIYLYSGHDVNIAQFCNAHKIPDYGTALIIEKLRGPDSQVYARYKSLVASILPDEESRSCFPTYQTQSLVDTCLSISNK